jgi:hypothetical protein
MCILKWGWDIQMKIGVWRKPRDFVSDRRCWEVCRSYFMLLNTVAVAGVDSLQLYCSEVQNAFAASHLLINEFGRSMFRGLAGWALKDLVKVCCQGIQRVFIARGLGWRTGGFEKMCNRGVNVGRVGILRTAWGSWFTKLNHSKNFWS